MPASSANTKKALAAIRNMVQPRNFINKSAELGSNNQQFEQAFSSLAHSYLADKVPKLLDYELGFQLIEKNDDGTRAVGIFAFKVGENMFYAPAFFLNGDLKGHELLYIKNQDLFVPLKDAWVNYLIGRKPLSIGKGVDRNLSNIGVQGPNLYQLSRAPYKWASDNSNWKYLSLKEAAYFATTSPSEAYKGKPLDIADFVKSAGVGVYKTMLEMCKLQPTLVNHLDNWYPGLLEGAASHYAPKQEKKASAVWDAGKTPEHHLERIRFDDEDSEKAYSKWPSPRGNKGKEPEKRKSIMDLMAHGKEKCGFSKEANAAINAYIQAELGNDPAALARAENNLNNYAQNELRKSVLRAAGTGFGTSAGAGATIGGVGGLLKGLIEDPGEDEKGRKKSRLVNALKQGLGGTIIGGGAGLALPIGAAIGGRAGYSVADSLTKASGTVKFSATKRKGVTARTITQMGGPDIRSLDKSDKEMLLKQRYVVKDDRKPEEMAHAYDASVGLKMDNPTITGIYNVLVRPDEFKKCLVVMSPYSCNGREDFCTVVELDSKKWVNIHPHKVWTNAEEGIESFQKWYDGLSDVGDSADGLNVILTRNGQGTVPFRVEDSSGSATAEDYSGAWDVHFRKWTDCDGDSRLRSQSASRRNSESCRPFGNISERIRFTGKSGAKINRRGDGELWVPADIKILSLKSAKKEGEEDCCVSYSSEPGPLQCGSLADVQYLISNHTYPLKVVSNGAEYTIGSKEQRGKAMPKEAAVCELIMTHNLSEKVACTIVDAAKQKGYKEVLIKKAAEANMIEGAPNAPSFPEVPVGYDPMTGGKYPTQETTEYQLPVQDLIANQGRREEYNPTTPPDHTALQSIMQAAQTGQKEVFDTTMLGGLLKSVKDDTIIDKYLPDLMKGMNGMGRLLFSFYWHQDQFADRYGKADLSVIEDGLRNAFDACGEILLTLKAKAINSTLDEGLNTDGDLSDVANV